jgi:hypothetical protein
VGAAAIPLPWLCRGSCMLMPPRPPPARARRRSQPEGQVMKALGRELSAAAAKMLIQAHPRPLLAEDHPRSGRGLTVFSPGPPRNGWSTAGAAARLDSSSATSRRRRECTVGTRVGAAVGRGGGLQRTPGLRATDLARLTAPAPPFVLSGHAASLTPYQSDTPRPSPRTNRTRRVARRPSTPTAPAASTLTNLSRAASAFGRHGPSAPCSRPRTWRAGSARSARSWLCLLLTGCALAPPQRRPSDPAPLCHQQAAPPPVPAAGVPHRAPAAPALRRCRPCCCTSAAEAPGAAAGGLPRHAHRDHGRRPSRHEGAAAPAHARAAPAHARSARGSARQPPGTREAHAPRRARGRRSCGCTACPTSRTTLATSTSFTWPLRPAPPRLPHCHPPRRAVLGWRRTGTRPTPRGAWRLDDSMMH